MKRNSPAFAASVGKWSYLLEVEVLDWIVSFIYSLQRAVIFLFAWGVFFEISGNFDIALIEAKISLSMHKTYAKICYVSIWGFSSLWEAGLATKPFSISSPPWAHGRAWSVTAGCSERLVVHGAYSLPSQLLPHYSWMTWYKPHIFFSGGPREKEDLIKTSYKRITIRY